MTCCARKFLFIHPSTLEPFLYPWEGLRLSNTCRALRNYFLPDIVNQWLWNSDICVPFGLQFCKFVTQMVFEASHPSHLTPTHFPRLQHLEFFLKPSETLPNFSSFDSLRSLILRIKQYYRFNVNPDFLPKNLTHLYIYADAILRTKHWPDSLTELELHGTVDLEQLEQWPLNLQELYISNLEPLLTVPVPLPASVTSLGLGMFGPVDSLHSLACPKDEKLDEWISKCEYVTDFEWRRIQSGPLILPPNVKHLSLQRYWDALHLDQLPSTIVSLDIPLVPNANEIKELLKSKCGEKCVEPEQKKSRKN